VVGTLRLHVLNLGKVKVMAPRWRWISLSWQDGNCKFGERLPTFLHLIRRCPSIVLFRLPSNIQETCQHCRWKVVFGNCGMTDFCGWPHLLMGLDEIGWDARIIGSRNHDRYLSPLITTPSKTSPKLRGALTPQTTVPSINTLNPSSTVLN